MPTYDKDEFVSLLLQLNSNKVQETLAYKAICQWVKQDENRNQDFTALFLHLDLHMIPMQFLEDVVTHETLVRSDADCWSAVLSRSSRTLDESTGVKPNGDEKVADATTKTAGKLEDAATNLVAGSHILCVGGKKNQKVTEIYNTMGNSKQKFPDLPNPGYAAIMLNDVVFSIGGWQKVAGEEKEAYINVYQMDTKAPTLKWEEAAPMVQKRRLFAATLFGKNLIVAGGRLDKETRMNSVELYEMQENRWRQISPMKQCRFGHALVANEKSLYAIGGWDGENKMQSSVEQLDDIEGVWHDAPSMKTPRANLAAVSCGGFIYALGGCHGRALSSCEKFHPSNNQWSFIKKLPLKKWKVRAACVTEGKIFVTGKNVKVKTTLVRYDPEINQWENVAETDDKKLIGKALVVV